MLQQEYANKYLESIGAYPTRENVDFVLNNLAIKDALVLPVWARSKIIIIPGMNDNGGDLAASMQEFLRYALAKFVPTALHFNSTTFYTVKIQTSLMQIMSTRKAKEAEKLTERRSWNSKIS